MNYAEIPYLERIVDVDHYANEKFYTSCNSEAGDQQKQQQQQVCSRGCGRDRGIQHHLAPHIGARRAKPIQLWEIQRTLGRGDYIEVSISFQYHFTKYIYFKSQSDLRR